MPLAAVALIAFAANSLLCRLALLHDAIDPASFSTIRIVSGAAMLLIISRVAPERSRSATTTGSWFAAATLFLYAVPFSLAYVSLSAGTGALVLFGSVQITMLAAAVRSGERMHLFQWLGVGLAFAGLLYLVLPGLAAPPLGPAALMALAGGSWGVYSLRGRGVDSPLSDTTSNFVRAIPLVAVVSVAMLARAHVEAKGVALAAASGSITSGLGYVIWYAALRHLTALRAAVLQLAVPILTAVGGVLFLAEAISPRLIVSAVMVLGGVALGIAGRARLATSV